MEKKQITIYELRDEVDKILSPFFTKQHDEIYFRLSYEIGRKSKEASFEFYFDYRKLDPKYTPIIEEKKYIFLGMYKLLTVSDLMNRIREIANTLNSIDDANKELVIDNE